MNSKIVVKTIAGAVLAAVTIYAILAAPGLLDDTASVVPVQHREALK